MRALSSTGVVKGTAAPRSRKLSGSKASDLKRSRSKFELDIFRSYQKNGPLEKFKGSVFEKIVFVGLFMQSIANPFLTLSPTPIGLGKAFRFALQRNAPCCPRLTLK
jgi:hypothetical protein